MKTNNRYVSGFLKDEDRVYRALGNYFVKFLNAYKELGVDFWAVTPLNEPLTAFMPFKVQDMKMTMPQMAKYVGEYLGPILWANNYTSDHLKLIVGDDLIEPDLLMVSYLMHDSKAAKYISGYAFHWYTLGSFSSYGLLVLTYLLSGDKPNVILMTEASNGWLPGRRGPKLGSWKRGEAYAYDIIQNFNRHTNGWIDWNLALDMQGGPSKIGNKVDSAILVDGSKGVFYRQPMYYALAHFSRYFVAGSRVIGVDFPWLSQEGDLVGTGVVTPDEQYLVLAILNKSSRRTLAKVRGDSVIGSDPSRVYLKTLVLEAHSVNTFVIKL